MITGALNIISGLLSIAYVDSIIYHVFATIYCSDSALYQIYSRIGIIAYLWIIVLLTVIWIIPDGLMLYGIVKKKSSYLIPWLVMYIILLVVSIGTISKPLFPPSRLSVHLFVRSFVCHTSAFHPINSSRGLNSISPWRSQT